MASLSDLYWSMMASNDQIPAMAASNPKLLEKILAQQQDASLAPKPTLTPDQIRQLQLQNQVARQGLATQTPQQKQQQQLAEILRRRALGQ